MSEPVSQLDKLQEDIAEDLRKKQSLKGVNMLTSDRGDLVKRIDTAIAKLGLCVVIEAPEVDLESDPMKIQVMIVVEENPIINRSANGSGKTAAYVAEQVANNFNPRSPKSMLTRAKKIQLVDDLGPRLKYRVLCESNAQWSRTTS